MLKRHPVLARALGDKLRVDDVRTFSVREQVADLAGLPESLLARMQPLIGDVHISATKTITEMGRSGSLAALHGVPAGYSDNTDTYDQIGGLYHSVHREVVVSTLSPGSSASTLLHEFGHAVDYLVRGEDRPSNDPAFLGAWRAFTSGGYTYSTNPYFTDPEPSGPVETFAEAFAHYYKWGESSTRSAFGPEVTDYINQHFGPEAWRSPPRRTKP